MRLQVAVAPHLYVGQAIELCVRLASVASARRGQVPVLRVGARRMEPVRSATLGVASHRASREGQRKY